MKKFLSKTKNRVAVIILCIIALLGCAFAAVFTINRADTYSASADGTAVTIDKTSFSSSDSDTGWSYDGWSLTLESGYSFTFTNEVTVRVKNNGTIADGTFNNQVYNYGTIADGTFNNQVYNYGTIADGTFNGSVQNNEGGTISGGTFNATVSNSKGGAISGGEFACVMIYNTAGTLTGATINASSSGTCTLTIKCTDSEDTIKAANTIGDGVTIESTHSSSYIDGIPYVSNNNGTHSTYTCQWCGKKSSESTTTNCDLIVNQCYENGKYTGQHVMECRCGYNEGKKDCTYEEYVLTDPECEGTGVIGIKMFRCTVCGAYKEDENGNDISGEIPVVDHKFTLDCTTDKDVNSTLKSTDSSTGVETYYKVCEWCCISAKGIDETATFNVCTAEHDYDSNGFCVNCDDGFMEAKDSDGDGVYEISNAGQLYWFAEIVSSGNYSANAVLTADIVVNENVLVNGALNTNEKTVASFRMWNPITNYVGTFDGDGHTISGLYCENTSAGLFIANNGTIRNLGIVKSYFKGESCGAIAVDNHNSIDNCYSDSFVTGGSDIAHVGGIAANSWGAIANCYNLGTVSGVSSVGGIVGEDMSGTILACYNQGTVSGISNVGGIAGYGNNSNLSYCYNVGKVICGNNTSYAAMGELMMSQVAGGFATISNVIILCDEKSATNVYDPTQVNEMTLEEFESGQAAYLLNYYAQQSITTETIYYQTLGTDTYPSLDSSRGTVYHGYDKCKEVYTNDSTATLSQTQGEHTWVEATCEKGRYCSYCGEEDLTSPATGHSYDDNGFCVNCDDGFKEATDSDGDGVYEISNAGQLYWFAQYVNAGNLNINARLTKNIVVNENVLVNGELNTDSSVVSGFRTWTPIGENNKLKYTGTFDGKGYTISGLYASGSLGYGGLFGFNNGTIKNVGVVGSYFCNETRYAAGTGAVVGRNNSSVLSCYSESFIWGYTRSGGVVGNNAGTMTNCYNTGTVKGRSIETGGVAGENSGTMTNCYNTGNISTVERFVGGIAGRNWLGGIIENCYNAGSVSTTWSGADSGIGGIVGDLVDTHTETNCYTIKIDQEDVTCGTVVTADQFKSGEVANLLNGGTTDGTQAFYQIIGTDDYPTLDSSKSASGTVYAGYASCGNTLSYSNDYTELRDTAGHKWGAWSYSSDEEHTRACEYCGTKESGTHSGTAATCTTKAYCSVCEAEYGEKAQHSYTILQRSSVGHWYRCANCGEVTSTEEHAVGTNGTEATCKTLAICGTCGEYFGELYSANHAGTAGDWVTTEYTHKKLYSCCGAEAAKEVDHTWGGDNICDDCGYTCKHPVTTTATCIAKEICEVCGAQTAEKNATNHTGIEEYVVASSTSDKKTHKKVYSCCGKEIEGETKCSTFKTVGSASVCTACGQGCDHTVGEAATCKKQAKCATCGISYGNLEPEKHESTVINWTTTAETHEGVYSCCGVETVAKEAHEWNGDNVCDKCGYTCTHTGGTATCTAQAVCVYCGQSYGEKAAHTYSSDYVVSDENYHYKECTVCGAKDDSTKEAHAGGTATCTAQAVCSTCTKEYGEKAQHSYTEIVRSSEEHYKKCQWCEAVDESTRGKHTEGVAATCTTYAECSVCGITYGKKSTKNHSDSVKLNAVEATCTTNGYTGDEYCSDCGTKLSSGTIIANKDGHKYESVVTAGTCVDKKYTVYTCSVCSDTYTVYGDVDEKNHVGETEILFKKDATCTEGGYTGSVHCKDCGALITEGDYIAMLGHNYVYTSNGDGTHTGVCANDSTHTVVKFCTGGTATCKEKAVCEACGKEYGDKASSHTGEAVTKNAVAATCTSAGYSGDKYCSTCGELISSGSAIAAYGHSYVKNVTAATCTDGGYTVYKCSRCGDSYTDDKTEALGHDYNETVVAPTCTADGFTSHTCSRCGDTYTDGETAATGHDFSAIASDENGHWNVCTVCGEKGEVEEHVFSDDKDTSCDVCGYTRTVKTDDTPVDPTEPDKNPDDLVDEDVDNGLPAGAIVGIVIGSVVVAGICGFAIVWFVIKKKTLADLIAIFRK